jgi:glycine hydroxymethyltransferase
MNYSQGEDISVNISIRVQKLIELTKSSKLVINLGAAEISALKVCYLPYKMNIQNVYVHGSYFDFRNETLSSAFAPNYKDLILDLNQTAKDITSLSYIDFRPASALGALTIAILSLTSLGDIIAYQPKEAGGHSSYAGIIKSLGRMPLEIPFSQITWQPLANNYIDAKLYLIGASETLLVATTLPVTRPDIPIIIDCAQTSGFLFTEEYIKPSTLDNLVFIGSTHKTLPLLPCGFIMSNNCKFMSLIDKQIYPTHIRTTSVLNHLGLSLGLLIYKNLSQHYIKRISVVREIMASQLCSNGLQIIKHPLSINDSHQIWISTNRQMGVSAQKRLMQIGIHVDYKELPFGIGPGLRLGVQQLAADGADVETITCLARIVADCISGTICSPLKAYNTNPAESIWELEEQIFSDSVKPFCF